MTSGSGPFLMIESGLVQLQQIRRIHGPWVKFTGPLFRRFRGQLRQQCFVEAHIGKAGRRTGRLDEQRDVLR